MKMNKEEIRHFKSLLRQGSLRHMNIILDDKFQKELLNIIKDYEHLQQELTKYKERNEKAVEYIKRFDFKYLHECCEHNLVDTLENLLEILQDKENKNE